MRYYRSLLQFGVLNVWSLVTVFVEMALHRRGPDCLPASKFFLFLLLAIYFPVNFIRLYAGGSDEIFDFTFVVADTILFYTFVFAVLRFFQVQRRFIQTAIALLGTDIFINLLGVPIAIGGSSVTNESSTISVFTILYLVLFLWWLDISGFIVSKAIKQPYVVGVMFVILYVMATLSILTSLTQAPA